MTKQQRGSSRQAEDNGAWVAGEVAGCQFHDARLGKRLGSLLHQLGGSIGGTIPLACQDWANTKAAYRFLSNDDVDEQAILAGHFQATRDRAQASAGPLLILQDTTEFSFKRDKPELVGFKGVTHSRRDKAGRPQPHTTCGILMHSSLAVTTQGLPLGLCAIKFWSRQKFKGTAALKRKINPTRVPIEEKESVKWLLNLRQSTALIDDPRRCVHIGDRESDIYELFSLADELGTCFLVRTCNDRLAGDGDHTIADEMADVRVQGLHRVEFRDERGQPCQATLELRYRQIGVLPPIGKQQSYPALELTVLHAQERDAPAGRAPLQWKLITNLPVRSKAEAIEKIDWYAMRWKIETFHKILKSGCRAEDSRLQTADRLTNLISIYCILSWRIFWLTMLGRVAPGSSPGDAFTKDELAVLDRLSPKTSTPELVPRTLSHYAIQLAKLGGYLARKNDPPPGNLVMWRGLTRLTDIVLGMQLAAETCG
ncbi:MAG: IS4 family transposase [Burkholderiales bacterium]|nr:IS4 family transposase [Burkholderiales bacterium]